MALYKAPYHFYNCVGGNYFSRFLERNPEFNTKEFTDFVIRKNKGDRDSGELGEIAKHEVLRLAYEWEEYLNRFRSVEPDPRKRIPPPLDKLLVRSIDWTKGSQSDKVQPQPNPRYVTFVWEGEHNGTWYEYARLVADARFPSSFNVPDVMGHNRIRELERGRVLRTWYKD